MSSERPSSGFRPGESPILRNPVLHVTLIVLVGLVAYANTAQVPFQFDDYHEISAKPFVRDVGAFFDPERIHRYWNDHAIRIRTIGYLSLAVNYRVHGEAVLGYHVVNLAIHIVNGLLGFWLVTLTFKTPALIGSTLGVSAKAIALFAALLFVSHPVQTQAVTYIVQRLASLATLWYLLAVTTYCRWRLGSSSRLKDVSWCAVSLISLVLAMKTKEIALTAPVVILLYELLFFKGELKKRLLGLIPCLLTLGIIPLSLVGVTTPLGEVISHLSGVRMGSTITRWEYLFTQMRVIVTYVRLLVFPVNQNLDYDYPLYDSILRPPVLLSLLFLLCMLGAAAYLLYRDREAPSGRRLVSFGILWFLIALSVESSIIPIADVIFEHRVYLPSVGFFMAAATTAFLIRQRLGTTQGTALIAVLGSLVVVFTGLTYLRNTVWQSEVSLWEDVISKSPRKPRGYTNLGLALEREGRHQQAKENFARATSIDPGHALAYDGLGVVGYKENQLRKALKEFSRAIALEPNISVFRNNRGLTYAALGDFENAIADYLKAIQLHPSYAEAYHNLGVVYHRQGHYGKAIEEYSKAIDLDPNDPFFYSNRGLSYSALREFERAMRDYAMALALRADFASAYEGRGIAHGEQGRHGEAIRDFSHAISLEPSRGSLYAYRAVVYEKMQNIVMALSDFQMACKMGDQRGCDGIEYMRRNYHLGN